MSDKPVAKIVEFIVGEVKKRGPISREQLLEYAQNDDEYRHMSRMIGKAIYDRKIIETDAGLVWNSDWVPGINAHRKINAIAPVAPKSQTNGNGAQPAYIPRWNGTKIRLTTDFEELESITRLEIFVQGKWFPIPLAGKTWIHIGQNAPDSMVATGQGVSYEADAVRLYDASGKYTTRQVRPGSYVAIAPLKE